MQRAKRRSGKAEVMGLMEPLVAEWFRSKFDGLTEPQAYAIPLIHDRKGVLVSSPTGSGKTLTAFLSIINELFRYANEGRLEERIYCVYVSPLKALANDINRNLTEPLQEMRELARGKGMEFPDIRVAVRSGDTSQYERQKMLRKPPHILITTPESLALVLGAPKFRERFSQVEWMIVDEIHDICDSKRGVHLSLTLERLQEYCERPFTRIGLSATLAPMETIAQFLAGFEDEGPREITLVESGYRKNMDMSVISPAEDITSLPFEIVNAKMYDTLREMVDSHTTTLVFTNTRSGAESVVYKLKERGVERVEAHHGSLSKDTRLDVEERLKRGELKCAVSSTSLELGIDIGSIDLVCQIGSPKSVAKALQRVGRSGHGYMETAKGRLLVMDKDDLVECAVLSRAAHQGQVDRVSIPESCLDVLAQSIVGMSVERRWEIEEAYRVIRRSYCYRDLPWERYLEVLRYLGSRDEFEGVYSKIWLDEEEGRFGRKRGARMIYSLNAGTIPEEANYRVFTEKGGMVGDLSEKFVERLTPGDVFVLGGKSYEFRKVKGTKAFVREASGRKPTVPSWTGEMLPRSFDLSMEIARFRRELTLRLDDPEERTMEWLCHDFHIDQGAARSVIGYFREQRSASGVVPDDRILAVEGYMDKGEKYNLIFHFPFGRRVNDALSRAYAFKITKEYGCNASVSVTDDAFMISTPRKVKIGRVGEMLRPDSLESVLRKAVKDSELFKQRFRHVASRSFMILRNYKGREVSVNRQQVRSSYLLDSLSGFRSMPVIEETYREILMDVLDMENARLVLEMLRSGQAEMVAMDYTSTPSPFAHQVVLAGISDLVLMEDRSALLRELHRRVLSKVMAGELDEFEFEEDQVRDYFRRKRGSVASKEDIPPMLRRTGPLRFFREKGRSIYPYSEADREALDRWALELLREGRLVSVYLDDFYFLPVDLLPAYTAALRREREMGDLELRALEALDEPVDTRTLADRLGITTERANTLLRKLESTFMVGRTDLHEGKWLFMSRQVTTTEGQRALDSVIMRHLETLAPCTVEEVAYALNVEEGVVRDSLSGLVAEGMVAEGRFLVSEGTQYMLKRDHLRLRADSDSAFDRWTVDSYRREKQWGPFGSIGDCLRFFGEVGMPLDVYWRVPGFDHAEWERLRQEGRILLGRFLRGRVRYILAEDAPMYVSAYRSPSLRDRDRRILDLLDGHEGLSMRELNAIVEMPKEELKESIGRLDRNMHVVRKMEGAESWSSENVYIPLEVPEYPGDARAAIVERFVRAYGPVPFYAIRSHTRFSWEEIRDALSRLEVETIFVGEERAEMYLMRDELPRLEATIPGESGVRILSMYDPMVQPLWVEISSRYGDRWIFPILSGERLIGAMEKWNMSGFVEIRELDVIDPTLLPQALEAIDDILPFYRMTGLDIIRVREAQGVPVEEMDPGMIGPFRERGYHHMGNMLAKGDMVPDRFSWEELLSLILRRQRIGGGERYENVLEGVRERGSFRSDAEAFLRCRVKVPLRKMLEQRLLMKVSGIPPYVTHTNLEIAKLYKRAKARELDQDMRPLYEIIKDKAPLSKDRLYDLSPLGRSGTDEALRSLHKGTFIFRDHKGRLHPVLDPRMEAEAARDEVLRLLFRSYGVFTAENLSRFLQAELPMREIRDSLARLEEEGLLVKGFLNLGDESLHWMMREDLERGWKAFDEGFVLTPSDNLYSYLQPWIRETQAGGRSIIFAGTSIVGSFRSRVRGGSLVVEDLEGGREARRILNDYVKEMDLTLRGTEVQMIPDWEIEEFYEKTHPGEV